jgi:type II secretory pathway component GspD/PulD (secretin)
MTFTVKVVPARGARSTHLDEPPSFSSVDFHEESVDPFMHRSLREAIAIAFLLVSPAFADTPSGAARNVDDVTYGAPFPTENADTAKILESWAQRLGNDVIVDPQIRGQTLKIIEGGPELTWGLFKQALDMQDDPVVIEEREVDGKWVTHAHCRRNLTTRIAPPFPVVGDDEALPKREQVVTAFVPVKNGCGADIFANVRGLLTRDVNRVGNILYVRGPEVLIVVDLAKNVDYYREVIRRLDVKPLGPETRVFSLARAPAAYAARTIQTLFCPSSRLAPDKAQAPDAREPVVVSDPRTNQLFVTAHADTLAQVEKVVSSLDGETRAPPPSKPEVAASWGETLLRASGDIAAITLLVAFAGHMIGRRRARA